MSRDIVNITRVIRLMRGSSQARLVEGADGRFYIAKFANNPQGNRSLINERIAFSFLKSLGVCTPQLVTLRLSESVIANTTDLSFNTSRKVAIESGLHLGSVCPVDPEKTTIFDFLPTRLLPRVVNLEDFAKTWVVDRLLGQADSRQAIFVRDQSRKESVTNFRAHVIDHGQVLGGDQWRLCDSFLDGRYHDGSIYSMLDMPTLCQRAVAVLGSPTKAMLRASIEDVPLCWFAPDDHATLADLFLQVERRWAGLHTVVERHLNAITTPCVSTCCVTAER